MMEDPGSGPLDWNDRSRLTRIQAREFNKNSYVAAVFMNFPTGVGRFHLKGNFNQYNTYYIEYEVVSLIDAKISKHYTLKRGQKYVLILPETTLHRAWCSHATHIDLSSPKNVEIHFVIHSRKHYSIVKSNEWNSLEALPNLMDEYMAKKEEKDDMSIGPRSPVHDKGPKKIVFEDDDRDEFGTSPEWS